MNELSSIDEKEPSKKHFISSLGLAFFATGNLDILVIVFLVDIAATFLGSTDVIAVSTASQILMLSSVVALVFGLFNSILSAKYNHKSLLLLGVFLLY